jgi:hypothetical protein
MGVTDDDAKKFLVTKLGLSDAAAQGAVELAKWTDTAATGVGWIVTAYDFVNKFFGPTDPMWDKLDAILNAVTQVLQNQDADKLSELLNDVTGTKSAIATIRSTAFTYQNTPSANLRDKLLDNLLDTPGGIQSMLGELLLGQTYRFIPLAYADPTIPNWVNGLKVPGSFMFRTTTTLTDDPPTPDAEKIIDVQVYEQENSPLPFDWNPYDWKPALPEPLLKKGNRKWDGLLCLPLIIAAIPPWQLTLSLLEPFYRLTGQWWLQIQDIADAMKAFAENWEETMLWTCEMPFLTNVTEVIEAYGYDVVPYSGYYSWPCGVLDPIMGVQIVNTKWWSATKKVPIKDIDGNQIGQESIPEFLTDVQRAEFKQQRDIQLQKLKEQNGYAAFKKTRANIAKLNTPPLYSPCLRADTKLLKVEHPGSGTVMSMPLHEDVVDSLETVWTGVVVKSSVKVTAPISVQPNPKPLGHLARAVSDVVFGYQLTVTPTGGIKQKINSWVWPLRFKDPDPSLYHDEAGAPFKELYHRTHTFTDLLADTWKTVTDGTHTAQYGRAAGNITFTMTVSVVVDVPPSSWKLPDEWSQLGALLITIEADRDANHDRSFELRVDVVESTAVDAQGKPKTGANFSSKTYTNTLVIPVDIYRIHVPTGYFDTLRKVLEKVRHVSRDFGLPGPDPDQDPVLELSLWRLVLEKNPTMLQAFTRELRLATGHSRLTANQALSQFDKLLAHLSAGSVTNRVTSTSEKRRAG